MVEKGDIRLFLCWNLHNGGCFETSYSKWNARERVLELLYNICAADMFTENNESFTEVKNFNRLLHTHS